jgi:GTP1/Obg family GTP-binding protein
MKLTISCPDCGKTFTIDLLKAQREIDRLRAINAALTNRLDSLTNHLRQVDNSMPDFFKDLFNA